MPIRDIEKERAIFAYEKVDEWLRRRYNDDSTILNREQRLMERLIRLDSTKYKKVTIEVLALFSWLRRFAEGRIVKDN